MIPLGDPLKQPHQMLLESEVSSEVCKSPFSKPLPVNVEAVALDQGWAESLPKLGRD